MKPPVRPMFAFVSVLLLAGLSACEESVPKPAVKAAPVEKPETRGPGVTEQPVSSPSNEPEFFRLSVAPLVDGVYVSILLHSSDQTFSVIRGRVHGAYRNQYDLKTPETKHYRVGALDVRAPLETATDPYCVLFLNRDAQRDQWAYLHSATEIDWFSTHFGNLGIPELPDLKGFRSRHQEAMIQGILCKEGGLFSDPAVPSIASLDRVKEILSPIMEFAFVRPFPSSGYTLSVQREFKISKATRDFYLYSDGSTDEVPANLIFAPKPIHYLHFVMNPAPSAPVQPASDKAKKKATKKAPPVEEAYGFGVGDGITVNSDGSTSDARVKKVEWSTSGMTREEAVKIAEPLFAIPDLTK